MRFLNLLFGRLMRAKRNEHAMEFIISRAQAYGSFGEYMAAEGLDNVHKALKKKWRAELAYEEKRLIGIEKAVCQSIEEGDGNAQDFFLKRAEETSERIRDLKRKLRA